MRKLSVVASSSSLPNGQSCLTIDGRRSNRPWRRWRGWKSCEWSVNVHGVWVGPGLLSSKARRLSRRLARHYRSLKRRRARCVSWLSCYSSTTFSATSKTLAVLISGSSKSKSNVRGSELARAPFPPCMCSEKKPAHPTLHASHDLQKAAKDVSRRWTTFKRIEH